MNMCQSLPEKDSRFLHRRRSGSQRVRAAAAARPARQGLTLAELGERVGRAPSVLSLIENGRREPKLSLIEALAAALSVPAEDLLRRQPPSRRAQLEIALEEAQRDPVYRELGLPHLRPGPRVPSDVIEHLVALHDELRRQRAKPTATPEEARRPTLDLRQMMRERGNYFARDRAGGRGGTGPVRLHRGSPVAGHAAGRGQPPRIFAFGMSRDLPRSARSVTDLRNRRIYLRQESLGMHTPRAVLLQTLGHFVLGHSAPADFADFLRQRVEANYFAAAVLVPEQAGRRVPARGAKDSRNLSVEDLRDVFAVSYEMAAHRFTNLATHHLGPAVPLRQERRGRHHLQGVRERRRDLPGRRHRRDRGPADVPAVVGPADLHGRRPVQPVLPVLGHAVGHLLVRRLRRLQAASAASRSRSACRSTTRAGSAAGTRPSARTSACPDPACCQRPPARLAARWDGHGLAVGAGALAHPVRAARRAASPASTRPTCIAFLDRHASE